MPTRRISTSEKVVFLFTSFPVPTETFLQREVVVFRRLGLKFQLVSLWGGKHSWQGMPVDREGLLTALSGILWIPYYLSTQPGIFLKFLKAVLLPRQSGLLNWGENLLGAGYALRTAGRWQRQNVTHFHAVWASSPAMAAWFLSELTGIPFSFGGHAYDLFENGGDGWLAGKIASAQWIRTSSRVGRSRLIELGADRTKIKLVRRGLADLPPRCHKPDIKEPVRFISVGRMVEKMGFHRQIPLAREMLESGLQFSLEWIGDGPERKRLQQLVDDSGLQEIITIHGHLDYTRVEEAYRRSDCFLFTGMIARSGDRAGLPNVVAEAMAWGLLVFSTRVGAVEEAVVDGKTGVLWDAEPVARDVIEVISNPPRVNACREAARAWIDNKFDLQKNLGPLEELLSAATFPAQEG